jgi:hypothetical protein
MANRLKNALWLIVGAVVAVWAVTSLVSLVRAGPMDPPGPPTGGTMKPLDQIEPRTAIWQPGAGDFPIVISQPGSYYLVENITGVADKDGILIMADNVTLDLNGFTLKGAEGKSSYNGITVPLDPTGTVYNLSIFNGTIRDWGNAGIGASDPNGEAINSRLADLILMDNGGPGVRIGDACIVSEVIADNNGGPGVTVGLYCTVSQVTARFNGGDGISASQGSIVDRATVSQNEGHGIEVDHGTIMDSTSVFNTGSGIVLGEGTVTNCMAMRNSHDGIRALGMIIGNTARLNGYDLNDGAGIHVDGLSRVEGNSVAYNDRGVDADGTDNIIIKNSATGNTTNYDIAAGNVVGQIIDMTGGGTIDADAWANFRY